jgi:predicted dehydrogenase
MSTQMPLPEPRIRPPRVGFLGTGRIGLIRMQSLLEQGLVEPAVISDPVPEMLGAAARLAPQAALAKSLEELLEFDLDGVVIATPSALHATQTIQALECGVAVFCQKPLGRTHAEVAAVVDAAQAADRALGVDLSYRCTGGMQHIRSLVRSGELGEVFAADLVFHNAYGPDKPWFFDKALSGGGCVMDLGVHLVDLALWTLDFPEVTTVTSHLFSGGRPIARDGDTVEDFATATLGLATGTVVRISCSWHLHAGRDAVIGADFYGTKGGASLANVAGSFLDFAAYRHAGTATSTLADPPDAWPGRAVAEWVSRLSEGGRYDPSARQFAVVADVLDRIYAR